MPPIPGEYYVFDQVAEQVTSAGTFTDKTSLPDCQPGDGHLQ